MIKSDESNQILILDVREQCEYNSGHLYGAVLMPYEQLQANISEFEPYKNQVIIVYCKTGARSAIASEILANNSFTQVYNMEGGIFAWINAGYNIYTTEHLVTASMANGKTQTHIEPLLLLQTGAPPCTQNQTCSGSSGSGAATNVQSTVLEQDENHTVTRISFEVNGTVLEFIVDYAVLWSYNDLTEGCNRTAILTSTLITGQNSYAQMYTLGYYIQCSKYNLSVSTTRTPSNSEAYNTSFTSVKFVPSDTTGVESLEFVSFNSTGTLSQEYGALSTVAEDIGRVYSRSEDKSLAPLAKGYSIVSEQIECLSNLVKTQIPGYDRAILESSAILLDDWLSCGICTGAVWLICAMIAAGIVGRAACGTICTTVCVEMGPGAFLCWATCEVVCNTVLQYMLMIGIGVACGAGGTWLCGQVGYCP